MKSWEKEEFEKCANCILVATCDSGLVPEDVVFTLQILNAITLEISSELLHIESNYYHYLNYLIKTYQF